MSLSLQILRLAKICPFLSHKNARLPYGNPRNGRHLIAHDASKRKTAKIVYVITSDKVPFSGTENITIHWMSGRFYHDEITQKNYSSDDAAAEAKGLPYVRLDMTNQAIIETLMFGIEVAFGIFIQNSFVYFSNE